MPVLNKRVRHMLGDVIVFFYAFFNWGAIREDGQQESFTFHKKSQYFFLFLILVHEQALEFVAFHYLLSDMLSSSILLPIQIIHIYGILYLIGDYNLVRRGRIKINGDSLSIHVGLRKTAELKISEIESIKLVDKEKEWVRSPLTLWVVATPLFYKPLIGFKDDINCQIALKSPIKSYGLLGFAKSITYVNLSLDNCNDFVRAILKRKGEEVDAALCD